MLVVGVCGSPRKEGNTEIMLKEALKGAKEEGAEAELIQLAEKHIEYCLGCDDCKYPCKIRDDMDEIYETLLKADIIILGSPIYYCTISGLLKNFMDRCTCLLYHKHKLKDKIGGGITVSGYFVGNVECLYIIWDFFNWQDMIMPGRNSAEGFARKKGEILKRSEDLKEAKELGKRLVRFYKKLKS